MDAFSYSSDIAPLQRNYFADVAAARGLSENEKSMLSSQYASKLEASLDSQIKSVNSLIDAQASELNFREQQFKLKQAADAAKLERDALTAIPEITKQITGIMADPSLDDATRTAKIAEYKFQNVGIVSNSKTVSNVFTAAEGTIEARKADRERVNALINPLIQTGQSETLKKVLEGKNIPMANDYIIAAEAVGASKKEEAEQKGARAQRTELLKRETAQQTAQIGMLNNYMSTLRKLAPQEADVGGEIGTLKGGPTTTAVPQAQPFKFAPENRVELEEMMRDLNPMLENEDLSKYSDENLYRIAVRSTTSSLKKLSGFQSGFPSNRFLANPPK
jgi:hypothetical protein